MASITVNGKEFRFEDLILLKDLLAQLRLGAPYFAVAVNDVVVPRSEHAVTNIKEGDRVEVIHAVGGG